MYHPSRGGVRGGQDQFDWEDVKLDKHRESYLGKWKVTLTSIRWYNYCHKTSILNKVITDLSMQLFWIHEHDK